MADIYYDLCIQEGTQCKEVLQRLISHGTSIICINRTVNLTGFKSPDEKSISECKESRLKFRTQLQEKVKPMDLSSFNGASLSKHSQVQGVSPKVFSRITLYFEEVDEIQLFIQCFKTDISKNFDVVAACPGSDTAFNYACDLMTVVDLIQLDTSVKPTFRLSHQMVRRARDRAINFELLLVPMLNNPSCRGYTVSVAQNLIDVTGGRSIVFSSGAASVWDVRNHIAMTVMITMLGVRPDLASHCIRDTPKSVMKRSLIRTRTIFGAMAIEKLQRQPGVKSVSVVRNDSCDNRNQQADNRNDTQNVLHDYSHEQADNRNDTQNVLHGYSHQEADNCTNSQNGLFGYSHQQADNRNDFQNGSYSYWNQQANNRNRFRGYIDLDQSLEPMKKKQKT